MVSPRLCANEVHLWLTFVDDPRLDGLLDDYRRHLTADELAQTRRFHFEADQRRHLVTRALLRCTLSRYADVDPAAWRFEVSDHGRPRIAAGHGLANALDFNISHTKNLVVVGVSAHGGLGVDTENVARRKNLMHLADHYFSPDEKTALRSLPPPEQHARFFEYWTLKEAYIKALGLGLSIPLDQFSFDLTQASRIGLSIDPALKDDATRWLFWQWTLKSDYRLALCVPRRGDLPPRVRLWDTLPWLSSQPCEAPPSRTSHPPDA
ncbi:4'-phosphopantetheinyl transferase family protein [Aquabacterium sp.]|uniref:4'-phosphopantetheinyl transferase family protein n=1 Tax=Aquabacterium sp. TaxID=1872578 RepID=UPI003D6D8A8F